jgi:predicted ArsR family transcriptional regulator
MAFGEDDSASTQEVASRLGKSRQAVDRQLKRLVKEGLVVSDGGRPARWSRLYPDKDNGTVLPARQARHQQQREQQVESKRNYEARRVVEEAERIIRTRVVHLAISSPDDESI